MAKATKESVIKAWSDKVGRKSQYDLREVETFDGKFQTQLVDKDTGSLTIAVDGKGDEALQRLFDEAGVALLDAGVSPKESTGPQNKVQTTSRGVVATPTQPAALNDPGEGVTLHMETATPVDSGDVPTTKDPVTGGSVPVSASTSNAPVQGQSDTKTVKPSTATSEGK